MLRERLEKTPGFATGLKLQADELERVRALIEQQWLSCLQNVVPEQAQAFAERGIERYHELSHLVDHASLWSRDARMLPESAVEEIRGMSLMKLLKSEFGAFVISDEFNKGWEALYLRFVRPHETADVGSIHADYWFWEIENWIIPANVKRFKVWLAVFCEPGLSGLRLIPDSHLQEWHYAKEQRGGRIKPHLKIDKNKISPQLIDSQPGEAIIFHDRLLHGGAISRGNSTRISLEFTILVAS